MIGKHGKSVLSLTLMLCVWLSAAAASGSCGKHVKWNLRDGVLTLSGKGDTKNYWQDHPWHPDLVKQLIVEDGVTGLGESLLEDCHNLVAVQLPSSLRRIGNNAFYNCKKLEDISIPYGVESLGDSSFEGCSSLFEMKLPSSVKSVGKRAFAKCHALQTVRLSIHIETLGKDLFAGSKNITQLDDLPFLLTEKTCEQYAVHRGVVKDYWTRRDEASTSFAFTETSEENSNQGPVEYVPADVDQNIPSSRKENENTYALIICNENYSTLSKVPYAINDGRHFALYCARTLGVPEKNIKFYRDATLGQMNQAFHDLKTVYDFMRENMKLIIYYAGHGAPEEATLEPYFIPVDASRVNADACYSMQKLYADLGEMNVKSAVVFLDACFSGASRDGEMVFKKERGIVRTPKKQGLKGNVVVMSATSDQQTALPYDEKHHGMFTYFLLKRLQETEGTVSLGELRDYIKENVSRTSPMVNSKPQTPTFNTSSSASASWETWKLID